MTDKIETTSEWQWWAGEHGWKTVGPEPTREAVIEAAVAEHCGEDEDENGNRFLAFEIIEARQDPLRLADWVRAEGMLEQAEEGVADSDRTSGEYDEGPWFGCTKEQEADLVERVKAACDEWQLAHGLRFTTMTFSHSRNHEDIVVPLPPEDADQ